MTDHVNGLHHVTSMASDARENNAFFTGTLGLRRVKKTVNFDAPDVYHLYYGDTAGSPGSVMTYFPFPDMGRRRKGAGEVGLTAFSVPPGSLGFWRDRLAARGVRGLAEDVRFGEPRLGFEGPDGDEFALVEVEDTRAPWTGGGVSAEAAIRGFRGLSLRLRDGAATGDLLRLLGYREEGGEGGATRFALPVGADVIDVETAPGAAPASQGAGSVHHVAFSVPDRAAQDAMRDRLVKAGHRITPVIDRDYFHAIYFRSPGGVLFEIATAGPGFDRDEDPARLGEALKLPRQHAHLRDRLEKSLEPLE